MVGPAGDSEDLAEGSSLSISLPATTPVKKRKRAETRPCPVCNDAIPIRLLPAHSELELERVKDIMNGIGSTDVIMHEFDNGLTSRDRRSAVRARKTLSGKTPVTDTLEEIDKTIQLIKRHRKQRHAKLREMTQDGDQGKRASVNPDHRVCPVCLQTISGDQDVMEAHVDSCLAHQTSVTQEENERASQEDAWEDIQVDGETRVRMTDSANLRGMGFHVRDRSEQDVEDEVDVDGDDEAVFGGAQFTEGDVLCPGSDPQHSDFEVQIDGDSDGEPLSGYKSLRDLVAEGRVARLPSEEMTGKARVIDAENNEIDFTILTARNGRDSSALIHALENKIKLLQSTKGSSSTSLICRICLDPYTEPTVSTGCWHTCCRECWLRCLGSTKLCPICKRITAATDLRRIYL